MLNVTPSAFPAVSRRASSLFPSPTMWIRDLVSRLQASGRGFYSLHLGQPGVPPPRELVEDLADLLRRRAGDLGIFSYTSPWGLEILRNLVAEDLRSLGRPDPDSSGVVITSGGIEGIFSALAALTDPGDAVGLLVPAYFHFYTVSKLLGLRILEAPAHPGLGLEEEVLKDLFSRSRAVVVANPDNPTGRALERGEARLLADLACDGKAYLVHDIAYASFYYEGSREWPEEFCPEKIVTVGTFSKDPGIPGWRVGFTASETGIAEAIAHVREATSYNTPTIAQAAVAIYLERGYRGKHLPRMLSEYRARRDALAEALESLLPGSVFRRPRAGIFIYVDLGEYIGRDPGSEEILRRAAEEHGVITVPGTLFGPGGEGWARLSFSGEPPQRLREAIEILSSALRLGAARS